MSKYRRRFKQSYIHYLGNYGYVTLLLLMRRLERGEEYEECMLIKKTIEAKNRITGLDIPTNPHINIVNHLVDVYKSMGKQDPELEAKRTIIDAYNAYDLIYGGSI